MSTGAGDTLGVLNVDAVVVGAGPNGLAAAIEAARTGYSVRVLEAQDTVGGATRSLELTLPGFVHDFGSAIHPLAASSKFFRGLPLDDFGLEWIHPAAPLAHPLDDGTAVMLERSIDDTARGLGIDESAYRRTMTPLVRDWDKIAATILAPAGPPRHPLAVARFTRLGIRSARGMARSVFEGQRAQALFGGLGAHSFLPLEAAPSAGFGLSLAILAHTVGWPFPRGGAGRITHAMAEYLRSIGGEVCTGIEVRGVMEAKADRFSLFDVTPRQMARIAGNDLPHGYLEKLRGYRYGPGAFKLDYALDGPIPWRAAECARAGTVHLGGTLDEISEAERLVGQGRHPEKPFVLLAQQSLFDRTRAPQDKETVWAYCHVPNGSSLDMTDRIEAQIERFAPGFRERILARNIMAPPDLQLRDANLVGGDINGGIQDFRQLFTRPSLRVVPYSTPARNLYLCSSSTPPGGGVHGLCGYFAARAAIRRSG